MLNQDRYKLGLEAKDFFMMFYECKCDKIAIENPIPSKIYGLPPYSQIIQPYWFGEPYQKRTCLWLKNLPLLKPSNLLGGGENTKTAGWFNTGGKDRQKNRSKTFWGVAKAMAEQWG